MDELSTGKDTILTRLLGSPGINARKMELKTGDVVHEADQVPDHFYLIQSGEIRLFHVTGSDTRMLDILGPGDWVGSASLARLPAHGNRAVAASPACVWAFPVQSLFLELAHHGDLAVQVIEKISRRLDQAWSDASLIASDDCRDRLIKTLIRFSSSEAASPAPNGVVLRITHAQLAQAVGAARETVSVCLTELRQLKMVQTGRNQLTYNPENLKSLKRSPQPMLDLSKS